ncbi:MAG: hypothetical protein JWQ03_3079 [Variovorax sp.]|nr:hypothetical protein [Variovorax sp.]
MATAATQIDDGASGPPPRIPPAKGSMAAAVDKRAAMHALSKFTLNCGIRPFSGASTEEAEYVLGDAYGLVHLIGCAFEDSQRPIGQGQTSEVDASNNNLVAAAMNSVGRLIALAAFMIEEAE